MFSEVLRQSCEVASVSSPVGSEVIESGGVRSPGGQHGDSAGTTHCLLTICVLEHEGLFTSDFITYLAFCGSRGGAIIQTSDVFSRGYHQLLLHLGTR